MLTFLGLFQPAGDSRGYVNGVPVDDQNYLAGTVANKPANKTETDFGIEAPFKHHEVHFPCLVIVE